jgi:hypothetical protein
VGHARAREPPEEGDRGRPAEEGWKAVGKEGICGWGEALREPIDRGMCSAGRAAAPRSFKSIKSYVFTTDTTDTLIIL